MCSGVRPVTLDPEVLSVEARITVLDNDGGSDLRSLLAWLRADEDLRGSRLRLDGVVQDGHMGVDVEMLTAILGPGSGAALMTAIGAYLGSRRRVRIRVEGPKGSVELDGQAGAATHNLLADACVMTGLMPSSDDSP
jgi:hypothetical protein